MVLVRAGEGQRLESRQSNVEDIKVPAGEAVDIFYRYGQYLTQYLIQYSSQYTIQYFSQYSEGQYSLLSQVSFLSRFGWCHETTMARG